MRVTQAMKPRKSVMFPSDLQGTILEDLWVDGYDSTLESNQDRYMDDFWKWCEKKCIYVDSKENEHTVFWFEGDLSLFVEEEEPFDWNALRLGN